ncbi:MAG: mercury methylation corrinoid protein HgcA [Candidatus Electryonea clarkiae]|nr:mercury methylation corrinoid protein HgcA [Candidatus Electryonea clarkiae]MDP8286187.1 mercury methylation corrinoid protein HgcA [Candidatus Electryonea clarkiae]
MTYHNLPITEISGGCCCSSEENTSEEKGNYGAECCGSSSAECGCENRKVTSELSCCDILGTWKARWGIGRMSYAICPGLYQLGNPGPESHVFVTANYKLTFDRLRSNLEGIDGWILVLDTKGINVWCAAGKGTFGTAELVERIEAVNLENKVTHRKIIVPQLGAVGVRAREVKDLTGFKVVFGPVRSEDIPEFLEKNLKATPEMRKVTFGFWDRLVLVPMEITGSVKYALMIMTGFFLLAGLGRGGFSLERMRKDGFKSVGLFSGGYLSGTALTPALLPWFPGKAFAAKGAWAGQLYALIAGYLGKKRLLPGRHNLGGTAWTLMIAAISSFMGMNFTGSSTYTSLSGVRKEMRVAVPLQIIAAAFGLILWIISLFNDGDNNE